MTGNGHHNTEFRFVDLEHAELCLESPIHDISCHLSGNKVLRLVTCNRLVNLGISKQQHLYLKTKNLI